MVTLLLSGRRRTTLTVFFSLWQRRRRFPNCCDRGFLNNMLDTKQPKCLWVWDLYVQQQQTLLLLVLCGRAQRAAIFSCSIKDRPDDETGAAHGDRGPRKTLKKERLWKDTDGKNNSLTPAQHILQQRVLLHLVQSLCSRMSCTFDLKKTKTNVTGF